MSSILSIIIPCYNSEKTLKEALLSCYEQGLGNSFEIVLVDDNSTDNTKGIILDFSKKYSNIKFIFNKTNLGGGATRNIAVRNSSNELIFCLDSDDVLPKETLKKMIIFWEEKKCDGVGLNRSIKFNEDNIKDISRIDTFGYVGEKIPFDSLFENVKNILCPLNYVFMFTKKAFEIAGGYPEDHGFDTQGFAWKFLSKNLVAYTCPEAEYLHRINFKQSYYLREYYSGRINYNWQKIFEEVLYIFTEEAQQLILSFDIKDNTKNLYIEIQKIKNIIKTEYIKLTEEEILQLSNSDPFLLYWTGNEYLKKSNFKEAILIFKKVKILLPKYTILDRKIFVCEKSIKEGFDYLESEKKLSGKFLRKINNPISICFRLFKKILKK